MRALPAVVAFASIAFTCAASGNCAHSLQNPAMKICPSTLSTSDVAEVTIPTGYRGLINNPKETAYYLVFDDYKSVDIADLSNGGRIRFSTLDLRGERVRADGSTVVEKVFEASGRYEIYVAENVETEAENTLSAKLDFAFVGTAK
jgi:hypothetical protein